MTQGIHLEGAFGLTYKQLDDFRTWSHQPLGRDLKGEIKRHLERLGMAQDQLDDLRFEQLRRLKEDGGQLMEGGPSGRLQVRWRT